MTPIRSDIPVSAQFHLSHALNTIRTLEAYLDTNISTDTHTAAYRDSIETVREALMDAERVVWDAATNARDREQRNTYFDAYKAICRINKHLSRCRIRVLIFDQPDSFRRVLDAIQYVVEGDDASAAKQKACGTTPYALDWPSEPRHACHVSLHTVPE